MSSATFKSNIWPNTDHQITGQADQIDRPTVLLLEFINIKRFCGVTLVAEKVCCLFPTDGLPVKGIISGIPVWSCWESDLHEEVDCKC